eukprot:CAMPEP_0169152560 /NCGR_PEP_ID=MMETSP1015-20121227/51575_1 /TAXON_ID=342587 /ORGANISM="Karlodinium micrum, Strain CCMP2283" /LENGTH=87 /DNA_ID=CAMNT_0009222355 /DNA_START=157 /DNA_END=420 /DNA_ORIENTATION=+
MPPNNDWSAQYYSSNGTLAMLSNSPEPDPKCSKFQDGTMEVRKADGCVPFMIPPTVCSHFELVTYDSETCKCPQQDTMPPNHLRTIV